MKRPISDAPLNFEMEDYEDSERTMTDVVDDGESVLVSQAVLLQPLKPLFA